MGFDFEWAIELVEKHLEVSIGGDLGVELADGAGGGVAGVGVGFLAEGFLLFVEGLEVLFREEDFAGRFQSERLFQSKRDGFDRADGVGDIFAELAVAASEGLVKMAVLIADGDVEAVDF